MLRCLKSGSVLCMVTINTVLVYDLHTIIVPDHQLAGVYQHATLSGLKREADENCRLHVEASSDWRVEGSVVESGDLKAVRSHSRLRDKVECLVLEEDSIWKKKEMVSLILFGPVFVHLKI